MVVVATATSIETKHFFIYRFLDFQNAKIRKKIQPAKKLLFPLSFFIFHLQKQKKLSTFAKQILPLELYQKHDYQLIKIINMKKNTFFRYSGLFLVPFLLLFSGNHIHSQSVAIYGSTQQSEYSIIRHYEKNVDITYSLIGDANMNVRGFNYVDRYSLTIISADIPLNYDINDFVVYNDCVYFCGCESIGKSTIPIYGFFDIDDVFFYNGIIKYYRIYDIITSLDIIKTKMTASGDIHMVMIGKGDPGTSTALGLIADAWNDASGNHTIKYTMDGGNMYMFNDVALTHGYAVISAIGTSNGVPNSHNILYYSEPTVSNSCYLDSWSSGATPLWQADTPTLLSSTAISITKMERDGFATVCNSLTSGNIVVSIFNDPTFPPVQRFELPYNDFHYKIVYNTLYKTLFILPDLGHDLEYISNPFTSTSKATTTGGYKWLSIDNSDNNSTEIISGFDNRTLFYWNFDILYPDHCSNHIEDNNIDISLLENNLTLNQTSFRLPFEVDYIRPIINNYRLSIRCP